ncbi:hypothetical protein BKA81DRAFT_367363 [Phyllosticta paracitricarpa]
MHTCTHRQSPAYAYALAERHTAHVSSRASIAPYRAPNLARPAGCGGHAKKTTLAPRSSVARLARAFCLSTRLSLARDQRVSWPLSSLSSHECPKLQPARRAIVRAVCTGACGSARGSSREKRARSRAVVCSVEPVKIRARALERARVGERVREWVCCRCYRTAQPYCARAQSACPSNRLSGRQHSQHGRPE